MFHDIEKMSPKLIVNHLQIGLPQLHNTNFLESTGSLHKLEPLTKKKQNIILPPYLFRTISSKEQIVSPGKVPNKDCLYNQITQELAPAVVDLPTPRGDRPGSLMVNNGSQRSGFDSRWRHFDF